MSYDWQKVAETAIGQWPEILMSFGIPFRPKEKNGPCPRCGGQDRSHFKQRAGKVMLYCRHCETHWGDQLLLELAFGGDFARMCQELGDYLHCQPEERRNQVRTQAAVAEAINGDLALAQQKIEAAAAITKDVTPAETHPYLIRYGIGANCFTHPGIDGALFPMKIAGQICDWLVITNTGQDVVAGTTARASKLVIKPTGEARPRLFVTADMVDAYHLSQISKHQNFVVCCGSLGNLGPVADSIKGYDVTLAIPHTLDGLEAIQHLNYPFVIPPKEGRKFKEVDYAGKPEKIYKSAESTNIYFPMLDYKLA